MVHIQCFTACCIQSYTIILLHAQECTKMFVKELILGTVAVVKFHICFLRMGASPFVSVISS